MVLSQIRKRDGKIVFFNKQKIVNAIFKAVVAIGGSDRKTTEKLADKVVEILESKYSDENVPTVEHVQDLIEKVLVENGHAKTSKAFMLYREKRRQARETRGTLLDIEGTMDEYLQRSDWRVNENANIDFSLGGLILYISGKFTANYWLNNIYNKEIRSAHVNGDFHIHDLSMFSAYCAGWSLRQLILEGFGGVPNRLKTVPAKHFDTIIGQMVNFIGTLQNEWAGAQAFSSFDSYLGPFVKKDNLSYKQVKQQMQRFMFNIATPSRWGSQTPFLNTTHDWVVPEDLKNEVAIVGGKPQNFTYGDCQKEADMVNRAFIETMTGGDASKRIFTFPIPTYNVTRDFDWDSENADLLFRMTSKYGIPYFQNFINSSLKPSDVRSMCCRLRLDLRELRNKTGGLFGAGENTGSIGVVTINMPRIGYLANTEGEFFDRLEYLMEIAKESLEIKRKLISQKMDQGLLPFTKRYLGNLDHHFSTIGLIGMNESCLNLFGENIASKRGRDFALKVLDFMREKIIKFQEETKHIYNLEATPGEGTSYRLAKIDKIKFPDIMTAGQKESYYTNSSLLPVGYTDDFFEALELQDDLQTKYTGGTVMHGFLGERINDIEATKKLVKKIAYNFRLPYYTITPTFSICQKHGYLNGEQHKCPQCGNPTEVYSRVVGYLRPIQQWNKGKKEEFSERKVYGYENSMKHEVSEESLKKIKVQTTL